jgi:hypothetical protein
LLLPKPSLPAETSASKIHQQWEKQLWIRTASNPRESVTISLQRRKFEDANAFDFEIVLRWDSKEGSCIKAQFHAP